ncbi:hypothetical protein ODJ79_11530 [Actinoplanes sp. KI2]|uniref:sensor histidine kinase n=1 Tax=Actinoplanes sp. KI2 TaxID=2983315 RepID=UPI0021D5E84B|nr:ATP-binding protein [Actinoplanes sp. KI2]MCU7724348.1 hypothetical protein [Actinoplanes sp. KI2]
MQHDGRSGAVGETGPAVLVGAGLSALLAVSGLWQVTERSAPRVLLLIPVCLLFTTAALTLREAAHQRHRERTWELISQMRPLALDGLGLSAALEDLARHTGDAGELDIRVQVPLLPRLPADAEAMIYRIVPEALTNAARHPGAHKVEVELHVDGADLDIVIQDEGPARPAGSRPAMD